MASKRTWTGWAWFAAILMMVVGAIAAIQGFVAILEDEFVVGTAKGLVIVDVTGWGWMHMLWGFLLIFAGVSLLSRKGWARWFTIVVASLNAIAQILFLANYPNAYPLWNILIVSLEVVVIYALTARWQDIEEAM